MNTVKRETLTTVIMTMNCEDLIEGSLKSVAGWVDEIVIVDGFSTDKTIEICRRYTDKIYQKKWDGYAFCTERNFGSSHATSDWVLQIDPDERASQAFKEEVLKLLSKPSPHSAYEFHKKNFFFGHWMRFGGWYHYSRHFYRRTRGHYEGVVHEYLVTDGTIGKIEAPVEHYPFTSFKQFLQRHNLYSRREAGEEFDAHGVLPDKEIMYQLKKKPLKRFFKFYVRKKGFLDGIYGLMFSILFAWVHFINWAKYWELCQNAKASK